MLWTVLSSHTSPLTSNGTGSSSIIHGSDPFKHHSRCEGVRVADAPRSEKLRSMSRRAVSRRMFGFGVCEAATATTTEGGLVGHIGGKEKLLLPTSSDEPSSDIRGIAAAVSCRGTGVRSTRRDTTMPADRRRTERMMSGC